MFGTVGRWVVGRSLADQLARITCAAAASAAAAAAAGAAAAAAAAAAAVVLVVAAPTATAAAAAAASSQPPTVLQRPLCSADRSDNSGKIMIKIVSTHFEEHNSNARRVRSTDVC